MLVPVVPFVRAAASDIMPASRSLRDPAVHLTAAVDWLCHAHDMTPDDGVSYGYSLRGGWRPSYIETTGYIACTFFNLAEALNREQYQERAIRMARWLKTVQNTDGSFGNPRFAVGRGIVFDTGQDLFGLVRAHRETGDESLLDAARRAGDWLVEVADGAGRWTRNTHLGVPHVYNTRVAWALLELNQAAPRDEYARVARANLDWAVSQERNGWFENVAFEPGKAPFTHTIAYAIRGLWEAGQVSPDEAWCASAVRAADATLSRLESDGFLPGQIDARGEPAARYCCLTGNVQMAIVWAKLFEATGEVRYRQGALSATRFVMRTQDLDTNDADIRGAIKGSQPIWGRYSPLTYPNWPAKFFVDAMLATRGWV